MQNKTLWIVGLAAIFVVSHAVREYGSVRSFGSLIKHGDRERVAYDRLYTEKDKSTGELVNDKVVVKFSATWCTPCKQIRPEFEASALSHPSILFVEIDVNEHEALAESLGIASVPMFIAYKNGKEYARWTGGDKQQLRSKLKQLAA